MIDIVCLCSPILPPLLESLYVFGTLVQELELEMVGYNTTITLIARCPVEHYLYALVNLTYGVNYRRISNFCSLFFTLGPHFDEMFFLILSFYWQQSSHKTLASFKLLFSSFFSFSQIILYCCKVSTQEREWTEQSGKEKGNLLEGNKRVTVP